MERYTQNYIDGQIDILNKNIDAVTNQRIFSKKDKETLIPYYKKRIEELKAKKQKKNIVTAQ